MAGYVRVAIVHDQHGVYLGSFMGLGFFSMLDSAAQTEAAVFESVAQATGCIAGWNEPAASDQSLRLVILNTANDMFATVGELQAAGLGHLLGDMPVEAQRSVARNN